LLLPLLDDGEEGSESWEYVRAAGASATALMKARVGRVVVDRCCGIHDDDDGAKAWALLSFKSFAERKQRTRRIKK